MVSSTQKRSTAGIVAALTGLFVALLMLGPISPSGGILAETSSRLPRSLAERIAVLDYKFNGLDIQLGEEQFVGYAYRERRVPTGLFAITGFTFGENSDLALFYRPLQLVKLRDQNVTAGTSSGPKDLPAAVLALEQKFAGLKLRLDRPEKFIDYAKPFRANPHKVPSGGANVLTGVMYGHRNNDLAMFYGTLTLDKTPDGSVGPKAGNLPSRVKALETSFEKLSIRLSDAESTVGWASHPGSGGSDGARISSEGVVVTAMSWGERLGSRTVGLAWD
jgi:hypothetical protein